MTATDLETVDGRLLARTLVVGALSTNTYLLADTDTRQAIILDPGDEPARILDATHDLHVTAIALTDAHWDHVLGVAELADALGEPILGHPDDRPVWPHEQAYLRTTGTSMPAPRPPTSSPAVAHPSRPPGSSHGTGP